PGVFHLQEGADVVLGAGVHALHGPDDGHGRRGRGERRCSRATGEDAPEPHVALDQGEERDDGQREEGDAHEKLFSPCPGRAIRRSARGAHQLAFPKRRMVAGTIRTLTSVASSATAIAIPTPIALTTRIFARAKAAKTATMIAAALVMRLPVCSRPS